MATPTHAAGEWFTAEEFEALGEDRAGERWELDEGELVVSAASVSRHNLIRDRLWARLDGWVQEHAGGGGALSETDVRLDARTVRRPDVMWYRGERWAALDHDAWGQPFPDLAFEIVSPNDRADQLMKKVGQYIGAGTHAVWLLYPKLGLAHRYTDPSASPTVYTVRSGQGVVEPELLPGFIEPLARLFAEPLRAAALPD